MNASKEVQKFVEERPFIKQALKKGIVNFSALARLVKAESGSKSSEEALVVAARRYVEKTRFSGAEKGEIIALLKKSRVEVKSKVNAAVFSQLVPLKALLEAQKEAQDSGEPFHLIKGTSTFTVITSEEFFSGLSHLKPFILKNQKGLVEITLKSPKEIESIPGVVAFLYSLFAERGINIVETTSCWTDTLFVISCKDLSMALKILSF
ncbi:MAG: hypothetical protein QXK06_02135 [Candidatus Diapherotrites archaeon]